MKALWVGVKVVLALAAGVAGALLLVFVPCMVGTFHYCDLRHDSGTAEALLYGGFTAVTVTSLGWAFRASLRPRLSRRLFLPIAAGAALGVTALGVAVLVHRRQQT
jgi:putative effector of murein hydrolase LrgA (UPF0299 family)